MTFNNEIKSSSCRLQVGFDEIEAMIRTVDRNKDGKISYSEFRVGNTGTRH